MVGRHAVARAANHVRVVLGNGDLGHMAQCVRLDLDVEVRHALDQRHLAVALLGEQVARARYVRLAHALKGLEGRRGVAADRAEDRRSLDAAHATGIGDGDALDVLDDVAGATHLERFGLAPQHEPGKRRGICDGDGLSAAQRADQLGIQQVAQRAVTLLKRHVVHVLGIHGDPLSMCHSTASKCSSPIRPSHGNAARPAKAEPRCRGAYWTVVAPSRRSARSRWPRFPGNRSRG